MVPINAFILIISGFGIEKKKRPKKKVLTKRYKQVNVFLNYNCQEMKKILFLKVKNYKKLLPWVKGMV